MSLEARLNVADSLVRGTLADGACIVTQPLGVRAAERVTLVPTSIRSQLRGLVPARCVVGGRRGSRMGGPTCSLARPV